VATGKNIEQRSHITGFQEEIQSASVASHDKFMTWFDEARDADAAYIRGAWDFSYHMALPLNGLLKSPEDCTALEIGHGGGRILAAASRHFRAVIGVDIHERNDLVAAEHAARGITNSVLYRGTGSNLPVGDASVDVVYSFIVLQHVEKFAIFRDYVCEAARVIKPGGFAVLYFARWQWLSHLSRSYLLAAADRFLESLRLRDGYLEKPTVVNDINLIVSLGMAKTVVREAGFAIERSMISRRRVPDHGDRFGAQHGLVLRRLGS